MTGVQTCALPICVQLVHGRHFEDDFLDLVNHGHVEPFSGLDVAMIDEVKKIILEVTAMDELNTVIIVSHDIVTTTALADRLWLLGYERDAAGQLLPGATIAKDHQYNLAEMGLAWHENVEAEPEFGRFVEHIKNEIRGS